MRLLCNDDRECSGSIGRLLRVEPTIFRDTADQGISSQNVFDVVKRLGAVAILDGCLRRGRGRETSQRLRAVASDLVLEMIEYERHPVLIAELTPLLGLPDVAADDRAEDALRLLQGHPDSVIAQRACAALNPATQPPPDRGLT